MSDRKKQYFQYKSIEPTFKQRSRQDPRTMHFRIIYHTVACHEN